MCWSLEASAALAVCGTAMTTYAAYTKKPKELWIPLGYFTAMEGLQAFQYVVVDLCGLPLNEVLTMAAYIHVAFQPFFINMIAMHFIPPKVRAKIAPCVYGLCGIAAASILLQAYPFAWAGSCLEGMVMCGSPLCTTSGDWHLAWNVPYNGLTNFMVGIIPYMSIPGYTLVGMVLPFIYGSWKLNLYLILVGPVVAWQLTTNINEAVAIWCIFSIGIVMLVVDERLLRKYLYVKKWIFWKK